MRGWLFRSQVSVDFVIMISLPKNQGISVKELDTPSMGTNGRGDSWSHNNILTNKHCMPIEVFIQIDLTQTKS